MVYWCKDATLEEKLAAWEEIIRKMPDCTVPGRHAVEMNSFHTFLTEYISTQRRQVEEFASGSSVVYSCEWHDSTGGNWYGAGKEFFDSYKTCLLYCRREMEERADIDEFRILKCPVRHFADSTVKPVDKLTFNDSLEIMGVLTTDSVFENMCFNFPTPFRRGDILKKMMLQNLSCWTMWILGALKIC